MKQGGNKGNDINYKSVVCIYVTGASRDYLHPWSPGEKFRSTGSGFAVFVDKNKYIMTNHHVVRDAYMVNIKKYSSDKKYVCEVIDIAEEFDLALLKVMEDEFWSDISPINWGNAPKRGVEVIVVGFPHEGSNASITRGIVSRITSHPYNGYPNIAIQIDAAVNPGNSGGPVLYKDEIVGIAFSHTARTMNMCYMIPEFLAKHFMAGFKKFGKFPGICSLGVRTSSLENQYMRNSALGNIMKSGIFVNEVFPLGSSNGIIKQGDVITKINDITVHNDQNVFIIKYKPSNYSSDDKIKDTSLERAPFWHTVRLLFPGDKITVNVVRNEVEKKMKLTLEKIVELAPIMDRDITREYMIFSGIIFLPLCNWHVFPKEMDKRDIINDHHIRLMSMVIDIPKEYPDQQLIIVSEMLPSQNLNGYYENDFKFNVLKTVNGISVKNIQHLIGLCFLDKIIKDSKNSKDSKDSKDSKKIKDEFIKFDFIDKSNITLNWQTAIEESFVLAKQFFGIDPFINLKITAGEEEEERL